MFILFLDSSFPDDRMTFSMMYPASTLWQINIDPENHQCLMETSLPTPMIDRVYVNLPEGIIINYIVISTINHIVTGVINQLSYLGGPTLYHHFQGLNIFGFTSSQSHCQEFGAFADGCVVGSRIIQESTMPCHAMGRVPSKSGRGTAVNPCASSGNVVLNYTSILG